MADNFEDQVDRNRLLDFYQKESGEYIKLIIAISSSAIGLLILTTHQTLQRAMLDNCTRGWLITGLISFTLCALGIVLSLIFRLKDIREAVIATESNEENVKQKSLISSGAIFYLIAIIGLFIGCIALPVFVVRSSSIQSEKKNTSTCAIESVVHKQAY